MASPVTITTDYDGNVKLAVKLDDSIFNMIGTSAKADWRTFLRFPLQNLPVGANVTKVRLKVEVDIAGAATHLLDIHPYNSDGQADPEGDADPATCYARCAAGGAYIDDSTELRTTGTKWFTLGDGEGAQACQDVEAAKAAVNRFSVGLEEEGGNDIRAHIDCLETDGGVFPELEITYEEPPPVVAKAGLNIPEALEVLCG